MKKIAVLNGPNLDRLGKREPEIYGSRTLDDLELQLQEDSRKLGCDMVFFQSNHEGQLIDKITELAEADIYGLIINPGGLTHTSVALRDAIAGSNIPTIEVHISNIQKREDFRKNSVTSGACIGTVTGLGLKGYLLALDFLAEN
ncbi:MAG: type II 3-dehydroquinate dehydratase [Opitutae bacterium]|jgi:3-dehydroquinate dehydratase II|nr:type II 3-dehydroquinate dehydratase [Opitutae bacterium]MBT5692160.1 type II 3-dehydroquinate dehydratase [Opitutae bacterium]MBT7854293.1 type II 3-dehydroquinate dehydratase [Opitutae bacterium]